MMFPFARKDSFIFTRFLLFLFLNCSLLVSKSVGTSDYFDQISKCEQKALEMGSTMADAFNAPINGEDWNYRLYHDLIVEKLGFAPWLTKGREEAAGLTASGKVAKDLQLRGGWVDKPISESPYSAINHKWIYMLGDSTTRQVWASYAAPFQGNHFERNAKEWTRHYVSHFILLLLIH